MKYLKRFNESLDDEFEQFSKNNDKIKKFINCLTDSKLKSEFKYRLTDGEDYLDLIGEFVDRANLSDSEQFEFRVLVMGKKIEDVKSKYDSDVLDSGFDILRYIEKDENDLLDSIKSNGGGQVVIDLLNTLISYLKDANKVFNWTYERPEWNPNDDKIKKVKSFINKINTL